LDTRLLNLALWFSARLFNGAWLRHWAWRWSRRRLWSWTRTGCRERTLEPLLLWLRLVELLRWLLIQLPWLIELWWLVELALVRARGLTGPRRLNVARLFYRPRLLSRARRLNGLRRRPGGFRFTLLERSPLWDRRSLRCWSRFLRLAPAFIVVLHAVLIVANRVARRTIIAKALATVLLGFSTRRLRRRNRCRMQRAFALLHIVLRTAIFRSSGTETLTALNRPNRARCYYAHTLLVSSSHLRLQGIELRTSQRATAVFADSHLLAFKRHRGWGRRRASNHRAAHEGGRWTAHIHIRTVTQHAFP
jgi:hypothetical protein